jgi:hypothetical protein
MPPQMQTCGGTLKGRTTESLKLRWRDKRTLTHLKNFPPAFEPLLLSEKSLKFQTSTSQVSNGMPPAGPLVIS